jgi:hypothetical protein
MLSTGTKNVFYSSGSLYLLGISCSVKSKLHGWSNYSGCYLGFQTLILQFRSLDLLSGSIEAQITLLALICLHGIFVVVMSHKYMYKLVIIYITPNPRKKFRKSQTGL